MTSGRSSGVASGRSSGLTDLRAELMGRGLSEGAQAHPGNSTPGGFPGSENPFTYLRSDLPSVSCQKLSSAAEFWGDLQVGRFDIAKIKYVVGAISPEFKVWCEVAFGRLDITHTQGGHTNAQRGAGWAWKRARVRSRRAERESGERSCTKQLERRREGRAHVKFVRLGCC